MKTSSKTQQKFRSTLATGTTPDQPERNNKTGKAPAADDAVRQHPAAVDEELKKTERNPESNRTYVKEQIRQEDA